MKLSPIKRKRWNDIILVIEFASDPLTTVHDVDGLDAGLRELQKKFPFIKNWNLEFQGGKENE